MRKICCLILILFLFAGCENQEEQEKNDYIAYKNNLLSTKEYSKDLPLDIIIDIEREDEQTIDYKVTLINPKENMHKIKAMVVNNYSNEAVFPTIGLFDDKEELLPGNKDFNEVELEGTIESTKNISSLKLKLKVWIEYQSDTGEKKEVYYQM